MKESTVYFANIEKVIAGKALSTWGIDKLCEKVGLKDIIDEGDSVAIKMHPGDAYCHRTIRPPFIGRIAGNIKNVGGMPFASEATPLYRGTRSTAHDLLASFRINGYTEETIGCPIVSAEGMNISLTGEKYRGNDIKLPIDGEELKEYYIASAFVDADVLVTVAAMAPTGGPRGVIKHIGMGCSSKRGKVLIHKTTIQTVDAEKCSGCKSCLAVCPVGAIKYIKKKKVSVIDAEKCVGCSACYDVCNTMGTEAIGTIGGDEENFHKRLAEAAGSIIKQKKGKAIYFGFLMDISGECECHQHSLRAYFPDLGILASADPVALENAGKDLLKKTHGLPGSIAEKKGWLKGIRDKFASSEWDRMLVHAEKMGLGNRAYKLEEIKFPRTPRIYYMP